MDSMGEKTILPIIAKEYRQEEGTLLCIPAGNSWYSPECQIRVQLWLIR
jgi:hypothetical protein